MITLLDYQLAIENYSAKFTYYNNQLTQIKKDLYSVSFLVDTNINSFNLELQNKTIVQKFDFYEKKLIKLNCKMLLLLAENEFIKYKDLDEKNKDFMEMARDTIFIQKEKRLIEKIEIIKNEQYEKALFVAINRFRYTDYDYDFELKCNLKIRKLRKILNVIQTRRIECDYLIATEE